MHGAGRGRSVVLAVVLSFCFASLSRSEVKTITRVDDPIVVEGKEFSCLLGSPPDNLSLLAWYGDSWNPVPFQIDQKKPDGSYCFTQGVLASTDPDPDLDGNDELVFMVKDSGDRAEDGSWPEGAVSGEEIELNDPKDGARGWLYLMRFSGAAPRSDEDYIRLELDEANHYRRVISYEYLMGGPTDRVYPDLIAARELPNGQPGLDVLDRLKMRGEAILIGDISIPFDFGELMKSEDKGYIDGPVRVLHLADGYLDFAGIIKVRGQGYSLISYYVNNVNWPMIFEVPMDDLGIIKDIKFYGFMDFNSNVYGSHPFNPANPYNQDVVLDGHMSPAEMGLDRETEIAWSAGFGPQGAMVNRLFMVPHLPHVKQVTYYLDDETVNDPPEEYPGVTGVGYEIRGFEIDPDRPPAVSYQYYYYMGKLKPEQISRILDIIDHPVAIAVKSLNLHDNIPARAQ